MVEELAPDERAAVEAIRRAKGGVADLVVPRVDAVELRELMVKRLAVGSTTIRGHLRALREITGLDWLPPTTRGPAPTTYDGPLVNVRGTVGELRASWDAHEEDLALKGKSGRVTRNHREAVVAFCEAVGLDWRPVKRRRERRSIAAREKRNQEVPLPPDFVDRVRALVHDGKYVADPVLNEVYRHSVRFTVNAFPRPPSELIRMDLGDVARRSDGSADVTFYQTKVGFEEGEETVTVPRTIDLARQVVSDPTRKSLGAYLKRVRPKLVARAEGLYGKEVASHEAVWVASNGLRLHPGVYRSTLQEGAQEVWPGFYPYLARELGIIVRALMLVQETGHVDVYRLAEDAGHESWDNTRRYVRKAKQFLRRVRPGPDLDEFLYEWRRL